MKKNRIYDIIGSIIATILATIILSQFSTVVEFFKIDLNWPIYIILLMIIVIAFATVLVTRFFHQKSLNKMILNNEKVVEKFKIEISELKNLNTKLIKEASIDVRTGALNKNQIDRIVGARIDEAKKDNRVFSLILVDIDNFKRVNDTYNHEIGNLVLKQIADLIKPRSKEDILTRYGGDEFLIITKIGSDLTAGYGLAERIRKEVQSHNFIVDYSTIEREKITISCGVTAYKLEESKDEILTRAAKALKIAKNQINNKQEKNFTHVLE